MNVISAIRHIANSALLLAGLFVIGFATTQAETLQALTQRAQSGDAQAQYLLAESYYRGEGVKRDYRTALKWYRQAADNGDADAQYQLGYLHQHGPDLVKKDDRQAFEWYLKAAEQGHVSAQTKVSLMYRMGKGVEKNPALARKWSMAVLRSKGLLEEEKPAASASPPKTSPVKKPAARRVAAPRPEPKKAEPVAKVAQAAKKAKPAAQRAMTEAEKKAWRREQARKLVEKMNREAAEAGAWSDVDE